MKLCCKPPLLLLGVLSLFAVSGVLSSKAAISFDGVLPQETIVGQVFEHNNQITLSKPFIAKTDASLSKSHRVCNMVIVYHPHHKQERKFPFTFEAVNHETGEGRLVVHPGFRLDHSKRSKYKFQVRAVDCDQPPHQSELVSVVLKVVALETPRFTKSFYSIALPELLPKGTRVIRVRAYERGRAKGNAICKYEISEPDSVPFAINGTGVIRTKEVLREKTRSNYVLRVTAIDCNGMSSDVSVHIEVTRKCARSRLEGLPPIQKYRAGSGVQRFASKLKVHACYATSCPVRQVTAEISLTGHEGARQQCDLDPSSVDSQRRMCGASPKAAMLLPDPMQFKREANGSIDPIRKSFIFDGKTTAFEVPQSVVPASHLLGKRFTLGFWLRHDLQTTKKKEQIICNADGEAHNRHHYSVFLHNCKLILLLRKEFSQNDVQKFSAAEWRFKLPEVCDGHFHHYALSYEEGKLKLYVDGHIFVPTKENFEVVDDYAMHNFKDVHFTRLMVGACWRSRTAKPDQHLKGELAGLTLVRRALESDHVIRCLNLCHEQLDFHAMDQMNPGMSVSLKADLTRIIVNGHNLKEVTKLVRQIGYLNPRIRPRKARRFILLDLNIRCMNESGAELSRLNVPLGRLGIDILDSLSSIPRLPLRLAVDSSVTVEAAELRTRGVPLFPNLVLLPLAIQRKDEAAAAAAAKLSEVALVGHAAADADTEEPLGQLDSCTVKARPHLMLRAEELLWPDEKVRENGVVQCRTPEDSKTPEGIRRGTAHCLALLRGVRYRTPQASRLAKRTFVLSCPEMGGEFLSNEVTVDVRVLRKAASGRGVPMIHYGAVNRFPASGTHHVRSKLVYRQDPHAGLARGAAGGGGVSAGVIVVLAICAGFFVLLVSLAAVRLVANRRRAAAAAAATAGGKGRPGAPRNEKIYRPQGADDGEMEWDNSALTITVNPMEMETYNSAISCEQCAESEDESSVGLRPDTDLSSSDEDELEEEMRAAEVAAAGRRKSDLEWDNDSLPAFTHPPTRDPVKV